MAEEQEKDSASEICLSEEQSDRPGAFSIVSVKSNQSKGEVPNFNEGTPSTTESDRPGAFSIVSVKSNQSKGEVPNFNEGTPSTTESDRPGAFSIVSVKSNQSKGEVPNFNEGTPSTTESERPDSFSIVSVKSNQSKGEVPNFNKETPSTTRSERQGSRIFSTVSVKSHQSKGEVPNFSEKTPSASKSDLSKGEVPNFSEETTSPKSERPDKFSIVSVKSHQSKGEVPNFNEKTPTTRSHLSKGEVPNFSEETTSPKRKQWQKGTVNIGAEITRWQNLKRQKHMDDVQLANYLLNWVQTPGSGLKTSKYSKDLTNIFQELEQIIIVFLKNELDKFRKIIKKENTKYFVKDFEEARSKIKEAALDITLYFLRQMKKDKVADELQDELISIHQRPIKRNLKKRFECVSEGIAKHGDSTSLNKIYTELYITEGEQVNAGHDMTQIHSDSKRPDIQEKPVNYTDVFKKTEEDKHIRTVLTKGVAGIGKSVSVQKFVLDWAEEKVNKDITFIFPLPFREINFQEKDKLSLMDLVIQYFPETKGMNLTRNDKFKILFIFDGLDECRLPLKFKDNEICRDVTMKVPLDVLLTNLFKGNLFSSALIWITSRPAAASKIPPECIDRVTEVRGFDDDQKQEYFRKKIPDTTLAEKIIKHVKESKGLFIMCQIPVFCWISATVLQNILEKKTNQFDDTLESPRGLDSDDTPQTLTQMYTHYFRFQILQSSRKYDGEYGPDISWNKVEISSLGNLAFQQLKINNLIFYDSDLKDCGIDLSNVVAYSGMFTQNFKEETGIRVATTYSFVHMSFQEFVAALYAHLFLDSNKKNVFAQKHTEQEGTDETMCGLLKTAVNKALESDTGHLDLFLRFLLGLSLKSNRQLLRGLLTQQDQNGEQTKTEIVKYIKQKLDENLSPERSINLFYCLHELNDQTLVKDIQDQLNKGSLSSVDLSPAKWSALAFVLVTSDVELEDFELQKFKKSDECLRRLEMVVKNSKRALLNDCNLTENSCFCLAKVFKSDNSLKELNMNNNSLQDSGVKELCTGLDNVKCKLDILRLNKCDLTEESCSALASVLGSNSTSLKELDLSNNKLQDSGVKLLSDGLQKNSTLEILRLSNCSITEEGYKSLASALKLNPSHLTELDLTGNDLGESGVKMLTDVQQHPDCTLKTLRFLKNPAETALKYLNDVLGENLLFKRELDLSKHELRESGLKDLAAVLEYKHCKIKTLILNDKPYIREEDCDVLASAFISNPSNLIELDLSRSKLKDSGIKCFCTLFENLQCKVEKLKFNCVDLTKEGCTLLASALNANPSHLRELDLTGNKIEDCGVTEISTLLKNSECRLEKLRLSNCSITEEGYKSLALALELNPSHLTELDLTGNDPGKSGVKMLIDVQKKSNCTLKKLRLLKSSEAEKGCQYVMNVVHENPLLLTELKLTQIKLQDTEVKHLAALLEDKHCKLKTIQFDYNCISESGCADLLSAFNSNPSNLKELDLSGNQLGNAGMEKVSTLLKHSLCRLEKLKFSNCGITENGYITLALALKSNPSHLTELNLTENDPGKTGVKMLLNAQKAKQGCKLQTIRFLKSPAAEEACKYLTEVLDRNPLLLTELDLSDNKLGDLDGNNLSALLMDSHSRLVKIRLNNCDLTEKNYSALAAVLSSNTILKEIDLSNSCLLDSGVKQLCKELKTSTLQILKLNKCGLQEEGCSALASVLGSDSTSLQELDLSNNKLQDSGVQQLSAGLQNNSTLKILRLSNCSITEEGYKSLASALELNPSHLTELDLTGNDPGESGVKKLTTVQKKSNYTLKTLKFLSPDAEKGCEYVMNVVQENPLLLREVKLTKKYLNDIEVKHVAALLKDKHCKLKAIQFNNNCISERGCVDLLSAFNSNPSNLKELDLSGNKVRDIGMEKISNLLKNPLCMLEKLKISECCITEKGYDMLVSTLRSGCSHVTELDLSGNDPGESGVNMLIDLLNQPNCTLKTLRYLKSPAAEEACKHLTGVLGKNPLLLKQLDLSRNKLGNLDVEKLSALLMDSHTRLEKIRLHNFDLTVKNCPALAAVLSSNTILKEMDLSNNRLLDSGVKELCNELKKSKLQILKLSNCSITEEGYKSLASALESKSSHLTELDLTGNDPGESGVKKLIDVKNKSNGKLKTLRFLKGPADEGCQYVKKVLNENPLLMKVLNLSKNELDDTKVKQLAALLEDKHCKPETLQLNYCGLTEQSCSTLAGILKSNSSLNKLDISNNNLHDSGVEKLQNGLKSTNCKLKILRMSECSITEEGYKSLALALELNPSHLTELDLTGNDPGESGVKMLIDVQDKSKGTLKTLRFLKGPAEEGCKYVKNVLNENPLLLRELNLSKKKLDDTKVKQLAALLEDKHCKLKTLKLYECSIKDYHCETLTAALCSNPSNLRELNFSRNALHNGVKHLCDLLKDSHCKLEKLELSKCSITEELCEILTAALCSNPSYLRELNLSENDLKNEGLKHLCDLLKNSRCKLEKLGLNNCNITDVGWLAATKAVTSLKELDLRKNSIGDSKKLLIEVLETSSCDLKIDSEGIFKRAFNYAFKSESKAEKSEKTLPNVEIQRVEDGKEESSPPLYGGTEESDPGQSTDEFK